MKHFGMQAVQKGCVALLTLYTLAASGCFITDCPGRRGKKDSPSENTLSNHQQSLRQVVYVNKINFRQYSTNWCIVILCFYFIIGTATQQQSKGYKLIILLI